MLEGIIKSVKAALYDRLSNPLLVSFSISWLIWNYRLVAVLLSDSEFEEKFRYIDHQLYQNLTDRTISLLVGPLAVALAYIFLWPFFERRIYEFYELRQKDLRLIKVRIDDETPLTVQQSREVKAQLTDLQLKYQKEVETLEGQRTRLQQLLEEEQNKNQSNVTPTKIVNIPTPSETLSSLERTALGKIAESERGGFERPPENVLLDRISSDRVLSRNALEKLQAKDLIKRDFDQREREWVVFLTSSGRQMEIDIGEGK